MEEEVGDGWYVRGHHVAFSKNYAHNQTFLISYYKDYNAFEEHRALTIGLLVLLGFYILVGPMGNLAIIGAIYKNKLLWKPLNLFIINLSLADLVEVLVIGSTSITGLTVGHQVFLQNPRLCNIVANICLTSCVTSLYTHTFIAITRYLSIRYQEKFVKFVTWRIATTICVSIWILAFILQMPPNLGWGRNVYDLKAMICIWDRTYSLGYTLYYAIGYVFVPVIIIFCSYIALFRFVHRVRNSSIGPSDQTKRSKLELQLAITLFAHFAMVFILWGQYAFLLIFDHKNSLPLKVYAASTQVAHSVATLNVFVYLFNRTFRLGMISFLTRAPMALMTSAPASMAFKSSFVIDLKKKTIIKQTQNGGLGNRDNKRVMG